MSENINKDYEKIILVGNANVGKSVIFNLLTGTYAVVSNYPGTTVEISQGTAKIGNKQFTVIDTPGITDLFGRTDDQQVTRDILLDNPGAIFVHVIDAKSLRRGLLLNLILCGLGVKQVVVLNMMDEANDRGIFINHKKLSEILGVPVVPMIATEYVGLHHLRESILKASTSKFSVIYSRDIENIIDEIGNILPETGFKKRGLALFLAGATDRLHSICRKIKNLDEVSIKQKLEVLQSSLSQPMVFLITTEQVKLAEEIAGLVTTKTKDGGGKIQDFIGRITIQPASGILIAIIVLFVLYLVVGKFGAGVLVNLIEGKLFGGFINPFFKMIFAHTPPLINDFFVGEYGIITMALTYGLGIVLPITCTFFFFFAFLEDCGYLPRLAFLVDRALKPIGLTGKAVLPLVLGLGCGTMATLTTRILDTRKEKIIATVLLALAIPCSAQLGVVLGVLSSISTLALFIWLAVILLVIIITGGIFNLVIHGENFFSIEIPPIRVPDIKNIGLKTQRRVIWYLKEALPLFVIGTVILFILDRTGVITYIIRGLSPAVTAMGLPPEMNKIFIIGFLRRDYGAAGMYELFKQGVLSPSQAVVSSTVLSLFVPCIAQFFVIIKERGIIPATLITIFTLVVAFVVGCLLRIFLSTTGLF